MIHLYQSNRLEVLLKLAVLVQEKEPLRSPLDAETWLVQSQGMQRWLQFELAREHGLAANLDMQLPAGFFWRLLNKLVPGVPKRSPFDAEVLSWKLLTLLPTVFAQAPALAAAWAEASARGRYNLAWRVADVFDQYLIYRPEWLAAWSAGKLLGIEGEGGRDEAWQAALWRELTRPWAKAGGAEHSPYRANLLRQLRQALATAPEHLLPKRLCVFGISNLPEVYRELLEALSARIPVHVFLQNPCQEYWGDARRAQQDAALENPLLASWGSQGRAFIDAMTAGQADEPLAPLFLPYVYEGGVTLLARLQEDILQRRPPEQAGPHEWQEADDSLRVHSCHSALREVEVLHDELLRRFEADPALMPHEVLVMTTDIATFAPLIDAVFGSTERGPGRIPYSIADRRTREETPILDTFKQLLALGQSRFEQEVVLGLLEEPLLAAAFEITAAELPTVQRWLRELHLRWGLDSAARAREGLPAAAFTWEAVLNRLFLGYALPPSLSPEPDARAFGILPADLVEGSRALLMSRLYRFIQALATLSQDLQRPRTPAAWADFLRETIARFFQEDEGELLQLLRDLAEELAEQAALANSDEPVPASVLLTWYERHAQGLASRRGFLQGVVTVCAMVPMRSLPFKVIAVLGLDDGVFPRQQRPWPFDLIPREPRPGDRSRREDDRYLFLETLLAAGSALHLSYVGRSQLDGTARPPSPLLAELLDVVDRTAGQPLSRRLVQHHALQAFSPANFQAGAGYQSFNAEAFAAAQALGAAAPARAAEVRLPAPAEALSQLSLTQLWRGLRNPARLLLRERFGIQPRWSEELLPGEEPVALEFGARQDLREALFLNPDTPPDYWAATGALPAGAWGESLLREEQRGVMALRERLSFAPEACSHADFSLLIDGLALGGRLQGLHEGGQGLWHFNKLGAGARIEAWLKHLCLCAARPEGVALRTELYSQEAKTLVFGPVAQSEVLLADWLAAYRQALSTALPFAPRISLAWAEWAGRDEVRAGQEAEKAWLGNENVSGEGADSALQTLWPEPPMAHPDFADWAQRLLGPLLAHVETAKKNGAEA